MKRLCMYINRLIKAASEINVKPFKPFTSNTGTRPHRIGLRGNRRLHYILSEILSLLQAHKKTAQRTF